MENVRKKAKELLETGEVKVVIGYGQGTDDLVRPVFIRKPEDTGKLIFDERCVQNLSFFIQKHEIKHLGKGAVVAPMPVLRSILQLASEHQITEDQLVVIGVDKKANLIEFNGFADIEKYIGSTELQLPVKEKENMDRIASMSPTERWKFWTDELSRCMKCYACRSACPMCYCIRCQVEVNQPQWITPEATPMGNMEWHLMRAMHLAGRCVNCGECARACPLEIPINLLTYKTVDSVKDHFGVFAGTSATMESVLSSYKVEDRETFIR
jgi:ferredoxin